MTTSNTQAITVKAASLLLAGAAAVWFAAPASAGASGLVIFSIPVEFVLFALTLLGVALLHSQTLNVALVGLAAIVTYKLVWAGFTTPMGSVAGLQGLGVHLRHEAILLSNLLGLLMGFALLADHFERSHVPQVLPKYLPDDWRGAFMLLVIVFFISSFLDNIAAALIGGSMAGVLFRRRLHIGYLAAIVAASNGGGAGSVVGDTTTTMMWIEGVAPAQVFEAFVGSGTALLIFGVLAARQQQAYSPIVKDEIAHAPIDVARLGIVGAMLLAAIGINIACNLYFPQWLDRLPVMALALWAVLLLSASIRAPNWALLPGAFKGAVFLLSLVLCASLMPVAALPVASWQSALGLGFISAVFDNIPLTALALKQGGYDWGFLAYAVGFGGSMMWFGSSAGVALANMYPEARNVGAWLKAGWHIAVAYVVGFAVMLALLGWNPEPKRAKTVAQTSAAQSIFITTNNVV